MGPRYRGPDPEDVFDHHEAEEHEGDPYECPQCHQWQDELAEAFWDKQIEDADYYRTYGAMTRKQAADKPIRTADGKQVGEGDRVFDYYDGHWGTIGPLTPDSQSHPSERGSNAWFDHIREDGTGRGYLNGERVTTSIPPSNPFYKTHGDGNPKTGSSYAQEQAERLRAEREAPFKATHTYEPIGWDAFDPRGVQGDPIAAGSPVQLMEHGNKGLQQGMPGAAKQMFNQVRDEHGNVQHVNLKSLKKIRGAKTAAVTPGFYIVGPNSAPIEGPFETVTDAVARIPKTLGAAVEWLAPPEDANWEALKAQPFPFGLNTVNGSRRTAAVGDTGTYHDTQGWKMWDGKPVKITMGPDERGFVGIIELNEDGTPWDPNMGSGIWVPAEDVHVASRRTAGDSDRVKGTNNDSFWDAAGYGHTDEEREADKDDDDNAKEGSWQDRRATARRVGSLRHFQ